MPSDVPAYSSPRRVLAEGRQVRKIDLEQRGRPGVRLLRRGPDLARTEVAVEVEAREVGNRGAAVHVAARDGAAIVFVVVLEDGQRVRGIAAHGDREVAPGVAAVAAQGPFHELPSVVLAAPARQGLKVDLLAGALSDVADVEVAREPVEREPPGVAQAEGPGLGRARRPDVRVVGGDAVVRRAVHVLVDVDAQQLAEQRVARLRVALRVVGVAAVAHADVEVGVRSELQLAAVVVRVRLGDRQEDDRAERVGGVPVERRDVVPRHDGLPRQIRVVHEEEPVGRIGRVKRRRQQPLLAAAGDLGGHVEEGRRQDLGAVPDDDPSGLQRHEDASVARIGDRGDAGQPGGEGDQLERGHDRRGSLRATVEAAP